ncbi:Zinc finger, U1-type [Corchorus olitorius]|uniref:Zinc finger, U1-type n=1 Tax=Corchorus olitorius TaxID=93759 RepID=A0A1R3K0T0_9ROSI|nr:Zinc finger, U1-type [Corchorus olitorius]
MQPANRGGRRGGKPFRGGTRGHVGKNGPRPGGSAPHNKGPGHSGSKQFSSNGVMLATSNSMLDPGGKAAVMPPSASVPGQATLSAQVPAAPLQPPPRMGWCELCRVDCNRPEILEQHKKGKRHQKNLQALEQQQKLNNVKTEQQSLQVPSSGSEVVQLKKLEGSEEKQQQQETLPPFSVTNESKNETEHQKDLVNTSEASTSHSVEGKRKLKDPSEAHGRGLKRKMRGGRGGKYMKSNEGPRRPVEPPKPKGGIPFMCELCNVKCESQVVFNSHLAGKKHIANMKRFHGHRAVYGEAGLRALYPPNANAPSPSFIPQFQQGVTDPQVVLAQLLTYVLTQAQVSGLAPPQVPLLAATSTPSYLPVSSSENHYPSKFTQGSLATSEVRMGEAEKAKAETLQQPSVSKAEASPLAGNHKAESHTLESENNEVTEQHYSIAEIKLPAPAGTQAENGALDPENQVASPPKDNMISATSECLATTCKTVLPSTSETDDDDPEEEEEEDLEEEVGDDYGAK